MAKSVVVNAVYSRHQPKHSWNTPTAPLPRPPTPHGQGHTLFVIRKGQGRFSGSKGKPGKGNLIVAKARQTKTLY